MRHRSLGEIYLHLVWSTRKRQHLVTQDIERDVYRCIEDQARKLRCEVLAIGGMPDHVHIVVHTPTNVHAADIAKQVKGVSSTFVRNQLNIHEPFRWQDHFAVFSICKPHVKRVVAYVKNQKQRHATGRLWASLEQTDEEIEAADREEIAAEADTLQTE